MELRQIRYFIAVVEAGSLLKASSRLGVAQPALGQQIAALEEELGTRLFARTSRGMQPTAAARTFLDHAKVVLDDIERARACVQHAGQTPGGEVAIGLPATVAHVITVPIVRACREQLPLVRLKVIEAYSGFLREWLQVGRLDLAVLFGESSDPALSRQPLLDERLALVSRPDEPRRSTRIALTKLAGIDMILPGRDHGLRRIIDDACLTLGLDLRIVAEIDSLSSVKQAVRAGIGSTILPLAAVAEEVGEGQLFATAISDAAMKRRVVLATNVTRPVTRASTAVARIITELIHAMVNAGHWPGHWVGRSPTGQSTFPGSLDPRLA